MSRGQGCGTVCKVFVKMASLLLARLWHSLECMKGLFAFLMMTLSAFSQSPSFDAAEAGRYVELALAGIDREFPNKPGHVWTSPDDGKTPKEWNPVFYGHFDWHSSVHGHWTLVRLLKLFPEAEWAEEVREVLDDRFTKEALQAEADYLKERKSFERMYGWAWALRLALELKTWDDAQGAVWAARYRPLERVIVGHAKEYLPKLDWPIRCGFHPETAFPLAQFVDYARGVGDKDFIELLVAKARDFYEKDRSYPVKYEPSGNDFFSPGLNEADLMRRVLDEEEFSHWLENFFPGLATGELGNLLTPVQVSDLDDGHLVHLVGLNLTRAWTMRSIAEILPTDDARKPVLEKAAEAHAEKGLQQVWSGSYAGEHWLGSFAIYLETGVGRNP